VALFDRVADEWLKGAEGGLVSDPDDPRGLTNWGISQRSYPDLDIASLTWEGAKALYHRDYWEAVAGDLLPAPVAACVFDAAVLQGAWTAKRLLQEALGVTPDGIIGPETLAAVRRADPLRLARRLLVERIKALLALRGARYDDAWLGRCFDLHLFVQTLTYHQPEGASP